MTISNAAVVKLPLSHTYIHTHTRTNFTAAGNETDIPMENRRRG